MILLPTCDQENGLHGSPPTHKKYKIQQTATITNAEQTTIMETNRQVNPLQ
jgi:hypothetical protein